jgi:hypothetical protein
MSLRCTRGGRDPAHTQGGPHRGGDGPGQDREAERVRRYLGVPLKADPAHWPEVLTRRSRSVHRFVRPARGEKAAGVSVGARSHPNCKETALAPLLDMPTLQQLLRQPPGGTVPGLGLADDHVENRSINDMINFWPRGLRSRPGGR